MKDVRDEILNHALELKLQNLKLFRSKAQTPDQIAYFDQSISECKKMIIELRFNGSLTP